MLEVARLWRPCPFVAEETIAQQITYLPQVTQLGFDPGIPDTFLAPPSYVLYNLTES